MSEHPEPVGRAAEDARRRLLERIRAGGLQPGAKLGGERDLARVLGVSRSTVRQALSAMERAGVVRRIPGRGGGTFVGQPKIDRDLSRIVGLPALLRQQGLTAGTRVLGTGLLRADDEVRAALRLAADAYVQDVVRIRLADGIPISYEHARLPAERFPGLLELPLGGSLYELIEAHYGVRPVEAVEHIEVLPASQQEAAVLDVAVAAPLLSITRTAYTADGDPFEYSHDLFRSDRVTITVTSRTP